VALAARALSIYAGLESVNATVENDKTIANQRHHVEMIGRRMVNEGLRRSVAIL
jgi:hypothetical protein